MFLANRLSRRPFAPLRLQDMLTCIGLCMLLFALAAVLHQGVQACGKTASDPAAVIYSCASVINSRQFSASLSRMNVFEMLNE